MTNELGLAWYNIAEKHFIHGLKKIIQIQKALWTKVDPYSAAKTAVNFANIYMAEIETNLIQQSNTKPREWKRYIDDVFSLWD